MTKRHFLAGTPFERRLESDPQSTDPTGQPTETTDRDLPLRRTMLQALRAKLVNLHQGQMVADNAPIAVLVEDNEPYLTIEGGAVVVIDALTGCYVLCEKNHPLGDMVTTVSEERLIDYIIGFLARNSEKFASRAMDAAITLLIGHSIADVERGLIVETLWHFRGNRAQTALALEISVETLNEKLSAYLSEPQAARVFQ
jgi:hypothetical protein